MNRSPNPRLQRTPLRALLSRKLLGGRKRFRGILLGVMGFVLSICVSSGQVVSAQKGWLRSSIKELDEPDRSTFLAFLDESRTLSDLLTLSLSSGNRASLGARIAPEAVPSWQLAAAMIRQLKASGARADLTYRNQGLELRMEAGKQSMTSRVWYLVGDPRADPPRDFLSVVVNEAPGHLGQVMVIDKHSYAGDVPSWLLKVDGPVVPPEPRRPK